MNDGLNGGAPKRAFATFWVFAVLAYLLTWAFTIPFVYSYHNITNGEFKPWLFIFILGPFGPSFAALIMAYARGKGAAVKHLLARLAIWRVNPICYVFALGFNFLIVVGAVALSSLGVETLQRFSLAAFAVSAPLYALIALPFGPLPEELGWRGYATPLLLNKMGVLQTSFWISLAWTFWHVPMYWFPGAAIPSVFDVNALSISVYWAQIFAESLLMTLLFIWSRGSVLLAILFHLGFNSGENILFSSLEIDPDKSVVREIYYLQCALLLGSAFVFYAIDRVVRRSPSRDRQTA